MTYLSYLHAFEIWNLEAVKLTKTGDNLTVKHWLVRAWSFILIIFYSYIIWFLVLFLNIIFVFTSAKLRPKPYKVVCNLPNTT